MSLGKIIIAGYIKKIFLEVLKDSSKLLPEVRKYLEEENAYFEYQMKNTKDSTKKNI